MGVQTDLKWIQQELELVEDPAFLMVIKNMPEYRKKMVQSQRISVEQYNKEIDEANARIDAGVFYTQDEVEKAAGQWSLKRT